MQGMGHAPQSPEMPAIAGLNGQERKDRVFAAAYSLCGHANT